MKPHSYCLIVFSGVSGAGEKDRTAYFMVIFAQDSDSHDPVLSHTFATFIKTTGNGPDKDKYQVEKQTISWLPASLDIRLLRLFPERGTNLGLDETLRWARSRNSRISMWGPYPIQKELYQRALRQVKRLNEGAISFKALDRRFRPDVASNCFHAVSDIDSDNGLLNTGTAHGADASYMVLLHLKRWIIRPEEVHDWVGERLGLTDPGIIRRGFEAEAAAK